MKSSLRSSSFSLCSSQKYLFVITLAFVVLSLSAAVFAQESNAAQSTAALPQPLITQAVSEAQLTVLKGNTHPLARPQFDLGTAPATLPMQRMLLVLKRSPAQGAALRKLLDDQQDKHSPSYHKWLTPTQYGQQFGPSDSDLQTITSWLQSHGFQVGATKGRTVLEFSGSASQVQQAFHTAIHKYVVNGEQHWANSSDPQIPTALTPAVAGIGSLHDFKAKPMNIFHGIGRREKNTGRVTPKGKSEFTFAPGGTNPCNGQDNNCYSVGPFDFAAIYNVLPLWNGTPAIDGTGQRIAIVQETNINIADPEAFRALLGLPVNAPNIILNGPDPGIVEPGSSLEGEGDIDVEWSGAVAKGATIDLVVSASTNSTAGIDLSAEYIVENNLDGIMSESFGQCEAFIGNSENQFYESLWEQAAAQGISVFVSAGDQGSAVCDGGNAPTQPAENGLAVSGFASTAFNVSVGGTDFQDAFTPETYWNLTNDGNQTSAKGYIPEATWDSTCTNVLFAQVQGFSSSQEMNCNNPNLGDLLAPIGGSGGPSNCSVSSVSGNQITCLAGNPKPSWQTGLGVPADGVRDQPDVSLFASNGFSGNSYLFCQQDTSSDGTCDLDAPFTDIAMAGGTSFGSPAFAGIMALIDQKTGSRQGNPNYVFYKLAAQTPAANCNSTTGPAADCIFNDVTTGTIRMPCATGSFDCTTNTVGDQVGILNGYDAATGYDLATGLGSVNVSNLVNQWETVTFTATATTFTLNGGTAPISVAHGTQIAVGVTVAPTSGSGTPTGDVALIADAGPSSISNQTGVADFTLVGGAVGQGVSTLPGGSYNVTAHYEGDSTFAPSDSASPGIQVTVTQEGSATTLSNFTFNNSGQIVSVSNGASLPFGSFLLVRADVVGLSNEGVPTGKVQFIAAPGSASLPAQGLGLGNTSPVQVLSDAPLNSQGSTSIGPGLVNFDVGSYNISAIYAGDNSFTGSSAAPITFTITSGFTGVSGLGEVVIASPGQSGTTTLGIVASTGFTTPVSVTCTGLPAGASCQMPSITPTGPNTVVTGTITVKTTGATAMLKLNRQPYYFAAILGGGLPLVGIFLLASPKRRWSVLLNLLLLALVIGLAACGGGGSSKTPPPPPPPTPTPAGTYQISVTATAGSETQQEGTFTLVVQ
jgi:hypothetical protein